MEKDKHIPLDRQLAHLLDTSEPDDDRLNALAIQGARQTQKHSMLAAFYLVLTYSKPFNTERTVIAEALNQLINSKVLAEFLQNEITVELRRLFFLNFLNWLDDSLKNPQEHLRTFKLIKNVEHQLFNSQRLELNYYMRTYKLALKKLKESKGPNNPLVSIFPYPELLYEDPMGSAIEK